MAKTFRKPTNRNVGAPDYSIAKNNIVIGYIEAKDIGDKDLDGQKKTGNKEQFDRYKASLQNLIFIDYLGFHYYKNGEFVTKIAIAEVIPAPSGRAGVGLIKPLAENFAAFEDLINFTLGKNVQWWTPLSNPNL
ncbi:MAG: hypothetical protein QM642_08575 [Edaphocola sp.]